MQKRQVLTALAVAATVTAGSAATASAAGAGEQAKASGGAQTGAASANESLIHGAPTVRAAHPRPASQDKAAEPEKPLAGTHYVSMQPTRSLDTRTTKEGPLKAGESRILKWEKGKIDPRATAITFNLTVTNPTKDTHVTLWSGNGAVPTVSSINVRAGETRSNQVTVPIGHLQDGTATIGIYNNAGSADAVTDIAGVYGTGQPNPGEHYTGYTPLTPSRVLDTRERKATMGPNSTAKLDLSGLVPADADSVTLNVTAINQSKAAGFLSVYPYGQQRGGISSVNYMPGATTPNQITVQLGKDKSLEVYNSAGSVDVLADLVGTYTPGGKGLYYPADPVRVADTRDGSGTSGVKGALRPGETINVPFPGEARKVMAANTNLTGVAGPEATHLTTWDGNGKAPETSNLNLNANQIASNSAAVKVAHDGTVAYFNKNGSTNVVVDVSGYFASEQVDQDQ
ncbi:hypothetical protein [Sciscionella marina]|uniref:hypothetical protein n=1 Tax=Sciscionella marina TaxID=508770 RepID=UPI00037D2B1E|nr:hypothetical protein [Sciscionella marina]